MAVRNGGRAILIHILDSLTVDCAIPHINLPFNLHIQPVVAPVTHACKISIAHAPTFFPGICRFFSIYYLATAISLIYLPCLFDGIGKLPGHGGAGRK